MNWLRDKLTRRRTAIQVRISHLDPIRLDEWRRAPSMVAEAVRVLAQPATRAMLAVLHLESPAHYSLPELGVTADDRAAMQARIEGYQLCLNNLEVLAIPILDRPAIEATFEPPEQPINNAT